jgi:hypothetical protein
MKKIFLFSCLIAAMVLQEPKAQSGNPPGDIRILADKGQSFEEHKAGILKRRVEPRFVFTEDVEFIELVQDGSVLNAAYGAIAHQQPGPAGMPDSFCSKASQGIGSSNPGHGYKILVNGVTGRMEDSDRSNQGRLGHRRRVLNPSIYQRPTCGGVMDCKSLTTVTIPPGTVKIGYGAFGG